MECGPLGHPFANFWPTIPGFQPEMCSFATIRAHGSVIGQMCERPSRSERGHVLHRASSPTGAACPHGICVLSPQIHSNQSFTGLPACLPPLMAPLFSASLPLVAFLPSLVDSAVVFGGWCCLAPCNSPELAYATLSHPTCLPGAPPERARNVRLQSVRLQSVRLQSVRLQSVRLQSVRLQNVRLQNVRLQNVRLQECASPECASPECASPECASHRVCVSRMCVSRMCVSRMCVSTMCVSRMCVS